MQRVDGEKRERDVVDGQNHKALFSGAAILLIGAVASLPFARQQGTSAFLLAYAATVTAWLALIVIAPPPRLSLVILLALLIRIPLAVHAPLLSADVYRYLWDGRVLVSGISPYEQPPNSAALAHLRDDRVEHRDVRSIYPPYAQLLFALWASLGGHLITWRAMLWLFELATILLLSRIDQRVALAFAVCPVSVVEGFWNGHLDVVAGALLLAAVSARRSAAAGALLGLAGGTKILPIAALPAFRMRPVLLAACAAALLLPLVVFAATGPVMPGMSDFATRWSFNSPAYDLVKGAIETLRLDAVVKQSLTVSKRWLPLEQVSGFLYRQMYRELLARVALATIFVAAAVIVLRRTHGVVSAAARLTALLLLLSPTIHPWYWLTVLPVAFAARERLLIAVALASPISYALYDGASRTLVYVAAYALPAVLATIQVSSGFSDRDINRWIAFRGDSPS